MAEKDQSAKQGKRFLDIAVIIPLVILFIPLFFSRQFRELLAVSLLGLFYSIFLVNLWERWTAPFQRFVRRLLPDSLRNFFIRTFDTILPLRSWGVVPCVIQSFALFCLLVFGWLLAPLFFETVRNPAVQGWIRSLFQTAAPEAYNFLNELAFNPNPYAVLADNAQEIFGSLNRFFSTFILPLTFIIFTGIGALIYESLEELIAWVEKEENEHSEIINSYSRLFQQCLFYNSIYYLILGLIMAAIFFSLNQAGITRFENTIILGLILSFFLGNLVVPGVGTIILTILTIGLLTIWQGVLGGAITAVIFFFYFITDDYLIKPYFLNWIGSGTSKEWDFGLEVLILGLALLWASFGVIGTLLLFPGLCFLSAYLKVQHPDLRPWILSPLKTISGINKL